MPQAEPPRSWSLPTARYATNLIDNIPNTDIIVYTDGSSLGNPGPAGAGYYIKFPAAMGLEDKQMAIPLGHSTNNVGELWAIGAAAQDITNTFNSYNDNNRNNLVDDNRYNIWWLSDSNYSVGCLMKGWCSTTNRSLTRAVKKTIRSAPYSNNIVRWMPGHVKITGNAIADDRAKQGAIISRQHLDTNNNNYMNTEEMRKRILAGSFLPP